MADSGSRVCSGDDSGGAPESVPDQAPINPADIRLAAMNLLARREHSRAELLQKLCRRFPEADLVEEQLQRLTDEGLQSDERFAESFVRQRIMRGCGPRRIEQEVRQRGIDREQCQCALASVDVDWSELAAQVLEKKFGINPVSDMKEKARRLRFMQYRGFAQDHYESLI